MSEIVTLSFYWLLAELVPIENLSTPKAHHFALLCTLRVGIILRKLRISGLQTRDSAPRLRGEVSLGMTNKLSANSAKSHFILKGCSGTLRHANLAILNGHQTDKQ